MKKVSLVFACLVFLVCFVGVVEAEVVSVIDVVNTANETETDNETGAEEVNGTVVEEVEEPVIERFSSFITGAVSGLGDGLDGRDKKFAAVLMAGLLFLFVFRVSQGGLPGTAYLARATVSHKRAQKAHMGGKYEKAQKLYNKSYLLREKGENQALGSQ